MNKTQARQEINRLYAEIAKLDKEVAAARVANDGAKYTETQYDIGNIANMIDRLEREIPYLPVK